MFVLLGGWKGLMMLCCLADNPATPPPSPPLCSSPSALSASSPTPPASSVSPPVRDSGVADVTGVDLDFPRLVNRADPHNLPFFDGVFDLAFTPGLAGALFPMRFTAEMEHTLRQGGTIVLALEWWPTSLSSCGKAEQWVCTVHEASLTSWTG
uniref:Methyltransferase type 11 domain-containing protein n=1 Tax=Ananas comosus var. bracteatus TaxID=296719 RepID=A0A6V7QMP1_ANACO|nr:unnamed protein product [Ananas comosus var. bracteatus]